MKISVDKLKLISIAVISLSVGAISVCRGPIAAAVVAPISPDTHKLRTGEPISPIPTEIKLDPVKVALGEKLFNDPQLSHNNSISCASCHRLDLGGTDQVARSIGINGKRGDINAPTVLNSGYNFKQFWDGRAETLEAQIDGPTHASGEMGSDWDEIEAKLGASDVYVSEFSRVYRDGIRTENIRNAIAEFERSLITPNSKFDQYLRGNTDILSEDEKDGYRTFKAVGCISCHQGVNIGGNLFQEFGVMGTYFKDRGNIERSDYGRYNVTHLESDMYVFKVPGLRNISQTSPYFHDGSAQTLEEAVTVMSRYQLGRQLSPGETAAIVRFLRTLDGNYSRYDK